MRVAIGGGGVMGCAVGARLARAGCTVQIFEKAVPGAEASSAAAGILGASAEADQPGPLLNLCQFSLALWPQFAAELHARTGLGVGLRACGAIELARSTADVAALDAKGTWLAELAPRTQWLDRPALAERVPLIGAGVLGGLWHPADGQVEPPLLAQVVARDAALAGAHFVTGEPIERVVVRDGAVVGVQTRVLHAADHVVIAAGAWTDRIAGLGANRAPIVPIHGQLAELKLPTAPSPQVLTWHGGYVVPRSDGRVVIGATTEDFGFDKQLTAGGLQQLLGMAIAALPVLATALVVRHWSGLRPYSSDGLPLLGPHRACRGLHFAAGHHRNGILLVPATARVVADAVLGRPPAVPIAAFAPG